MLRGFVVDNLASWQVDLMEENARNQQWEELCFDPDEGRREEAVSHLKTAVENLTNAWTAILDAVTAIDGLPEANEVESFEEQVSEIKSGLRQMQTKILRGF